MAETSEAMSAEHGVIADTEAAEGVERAEGVEEVCYTHLTLVLHIRIH